MKTDQQVAIVSRMAGHSHFRHLSWILVTLYQPEYRAPEPEVYSPLYPDRLWGIMTSFVCVHLKNRCFDCKFVQLSLVMRSSTHIAACCVLLFHLFVVVILNREIKELGEGFESKQSGNFNNEMLSCLLRQEIYAIPALMLLSLQGFFTPILLAQWGSMPLFPGGKKAELSLK